MKTLRLLALALVALPLCGCLHPTLHIVRRVPVLRPLPMPRH